MAEISDLEQQVFNMKLKVHEYERRLSEVNLHGLTGETLQAENKKLNAQAAGLQSEKANLLKKVSTLTDICVKTRAAIEKLQTEVGSLSSAHERDTLRISHLKSKEESLTKANEDLETKLAEAAKAEEALVVANDKVCSLETHNHQLCESVDSLKQDITDHTKTKEELKSIQVKLSDLEKIHDSLSQELEAKAASLESVQKEKDELMHEAEKKVKLELALKGDELASSFKSTSAEYEQRIIELERTNSTLGQMKNELEIECERYKALFKKSESSEKELQRSHAILQADMRTHKSKEEMGLRTMRESFDKEMRELVNKQQVERRVLEYAHKNALEESEKRQLKLRDGIDRLRKELRAKSTEADTRVEVLTKELESLRKKWQASITNKRGSSRTQDNRPKKRLSIESSVSYTSGSNRSACENNAVAGQTSSENAPSNSGTTKRRKKIEAKTKPVASRFMQPKERFR